MYGLPSGTTPATVFLSHSQPIAHPNPPIQDSLASRNGNRRKAPHLYAGDFQPKRRIYRNRRLAILSFTKAINWLEGLLYIGRPFSSSSAQETACAPIIWLVGVTNGGKPASIRTCGMSDIAFSNKSICPNCFNWATIFVYIPPGICAFSPTRSARGNQNTPRSHGNKAANRPPYLSERPRWHR